MINYHKNTDLKNNIKSKIIPKVQYCIVLWQHTLQKYRNDCKYSETQYSKLTVKASRVSLSLPNVQTIDVTV